MLVTQGTSRRSPQCSNSAAIGGEPDMSRTSSIRRGKTHLCQLNISGNISDSTCCRDRKRKPPARGGSWIAPVGDIGKYAATHRLRTQPIDRAFLLKRRTGQCLGGWRSIEKREEGRFLIAAGRGAFGLRSCVFLQLEQCELSRPCLPALFAPQFEQITPRDALALDDDELRGRHGSVLVRAHYR